jgi:hypothetical protein
MSAQYFDVGPVLRVRRLIDRRVRAKALRTGVPKALAVAVRVERTRLVVARGLNGDVARVRRAGVMTTRPLRSAVFGAEVIACVMARDAIPMSGRARVGARGLERRIAMGVRVHHGPVRRAGPRACASDDRHGNVQRDSEPERWRTCHADQWSTVLVPWTVARSSLRYAPTVPIS